MIDTAVLQVRVASEMELVTITEAFNRGFSDYRYKAQFSPEQMRRFVRRGGIDLDASAVLVALEGGHWRGAGVAFLAHAGREGWCGGLAVAPEYRGQGGARRLMQAIHDKAAAAAVDTMWLEVLRDNSRAQRFYSSLGYAYTRTLQLWEAPAAQPTSAPAGYCLEQVAVGAVLDPLFAWQRERTAWQRRRRAAELAYSDLWGYRLQAEDGSVAGYALCLPLPPQQPGEPRVRLMAIGVRPGAGSDEASALIAALRAQLDGAVLNLLNEPENSLFVPALQAAGFAVQDEQYEMRLSLPGLPPGEVVQDGL
ncbi:MAG: GNAT family N-acetyltransferase [Caldilineaceae bacterium]|nr:GNAT family N-acetyltransferase [Caldilineaceae bacterium]